MSAHTHTLRHTDTSPHTVTHTDRHTYIDRQHKRLLLICCICYGAHLLASSSMCVLSTEYICMYVCACVVCVCVCAAIASVCYLCCDNRFKRFTHSPSKCNLSSFQLDIDLAAPNRLPPPPGPLPPLPSLPSFVHCVASFGLGDCVLITLNFNSKWKSRQKTSEKLC